ncbi:reverse transcriptase [Gossypium australe]|uniref:Reverse transcriptase n=1 Tax=Gossypium australe TaxID=47621 RepID=A0A5B6VD77_9ROSI|nr:reverse transcriptase [Gossypium australe]
MLTLIMQCVRIVEFTVLLNEKRGEKFKPSRGLRQGDLLSPCLFLFYAEGFVSLLRLAKNGLIKGVRVGSSNVFISHLFFVDDSFLFGEASMEGTNALKAIINEYEGVSGSHPSFTWRSIWSARGLLEVGLGWRIGGGSTINIWNDAWLPGAGQERTVDQNINIKYTMVADFIDTGQCTWKADILQEIFDDV